MNEKKLEYSNVMVNIPDDERLSTWGENAYLYRNQYIDKVDEQAFSSEEEVDEAILEATTKFREEYKLD